MSSIRNEDLAISRGDLDVLDEFMLALGFDYYPGYDNKTEPANMPWSTRWWKHGIVTYTDGKKGGRGVDPEFASFLHQHLIIKSKDDLPPY